MNSQEVLKSIATAAGVFSLSAAVTSACLDNTSDGEAQISNDLQSLTHINHLPESQNFDDLYALCESTSQQADLVLSSLETVSDENQCDMIAKAIPEFFKVFDYCSQVTEGRFMNLSDAQQNHLNQATFFTFLSYITLENLVFQHISCSGTNFEKNPEPDTGYFMPLQNGTGNETGIFL